MAHRTKREREISLIERATAVQWRYLQRFERVDDSKQAEAYFRSRLAHVRHEQMLALSLDGRFHVIGCDLVALGSIDHAHVEPRVLLQSVLDRNARHVILAHNHPSGDCTPSNDDIAITNKLIDLLHAIDVQLLDHLIIGAERSYSFNDGGLLWTAAAQRRARLLLPSGDCGSRRRVDGQGPRSGGRTGVRPFSSGQDGLSKSPGHP